MWSFRKFFIFNLGLLLSFSFSFNLYAKRYSIPSNNEVIVKFNNNSHCIAEVSKVFSVLVWNMYKGLYLGWQSEFPRLSHDKNFLILQEGLLNKRMVDIFNGSVDFNFIFATSFIDSKFGPEKSGVSTASRICTKNNLWQRSYYREPLIRTPKMTLFTEYEIQDSSETLLVGNIHGINFVPTYKLRHMLQQAQKIIKSHTGPVIFAGDFNTWSKRKLRTMRRIFFNLDMKQVKFKKDQRKSFRGRVLDHVWYRGMTVNWANSVHSKGSDHAPMEVEFKFMATYFGDE